MATKTPSWTSNTPAIRRLTWWFDHHQSAFLNAEDQEHFRRDTSGRKLYDPSYKSCTAFICRVACERFGFRAPDLDDLVHWSLIIDGAQYPDARTAVELGAPAMKLTLVIEAAKGCGIVQKIIGWMQHRQLAEIIMEPEIQALYVPLYQRHVESIDLIQRRAQQDDGVVFFDLAGDDVEGYNKFIPYYLFPSFDLHGIGEPFQFPDQDFGGVEPVDAGGAEAQSGIHLRALRRRRTRARGRDQPVARRAGTGPRDRGRDRGGVEDVGRASWPVPLQ